MVDPVAVSIFNQLLGQYNGSISAIQSGSIDIAKELFNAIALVSVAVLGINRLLSRNVDMVESNIELIRLLIYLNVFYLFISRYDQFLPLIFNSFKAAGIYMGGKAGGYSLSTNPGSIINIGVSIASKILNAAKNQTSLANIGLSLIAVVAALVVLYCFGIIAIELILIDIGSRIILAGGIFLLAFAGSSWTREYAEHYVHTFFHLGVKMLFVYILVGIGAGVSSHWTKILDNIPIGQIIEYYIAVIMASLVYYKICQKLPDQAVVYFTGRLSMNYETASTINAVVKDVAKIAKSAVGGVPAIVGMTKAVGAARQAVKTSLESQGEKDNPLNTGFEIIKTLGAAKQEVKQEAWDRKVSDTMGGKMAKDILDGIPKPKRETRKSTKKNPGGNSNNASTDYAI
ncbi:MAG: P-type conjugative transfer protein TrbL [Candidatus Omnitrophica bacterium]|nr:P-type conjugative transfer protein TrbL [Candidatus Omnitrophota bacterium]